MSVLNSLHLYLRFLGVSVQSQIQYRVSFVLTTLGHFAATAIEFLATLVLFDRFDALDEWSLAEVAFFYGVVNIAFSLADAASYGFDNFGNMVKSGDFDRLLLRPRSTTLQLAGQELTLRRVGRLAQGLVVLLWANAALEISWTAAKLALLLGAIGGGAALFMSLVVLQATMAFWTVESLEMFNAITYGGGAGLPVPAGDLPVLVQEVPNLRGAAGDGELLSLSGHHRAGRSSRVDPAGPVPLPVGRRSLPVCLPQGVELRRTTLPVYGQLRALGAAYGPG